MKRSFVPALIVHGGAGGARSRGEIPSYLRALENALREGLRALKTGSSLDAVQVAVEYMEDSGVFNAGRGASLTSDGRIQLDAAVMVGRELKAGAVGACECTYRVTRLARVVMEKTNHVLIVGDGCRAVASKARLEIEELHPTHSVLKRYEEAARAIAAGKRSKSKKSMGGTVGAVALDSAGIPSAAVSTGGTWLKVPGRVGDSSVIGAGIYADEGAGAACATGIGEEILRNALSWEACRLMKGGDAMTAAKRSIQALTRRSGRGTAGIITVDLRGEVGFAYNTPVMGRGWFDRHRERIVVALR